MIGHLEEYQEGDKVIFEHNRIWFEAIVTHTYPPTDESHGFWTYGITITDSDYDDTRRKRDTFWAYGNQLSLIQEVS